MITLWSSTVPTLFFDELRLDALVDRDEHGLGVFHAFEGVHGCANLLPLLLEHGLLLSLTHSFAINDDSLRPDLVRILGSRRKTVSQFQPLRLFLRFAVVFLRTSFSASIL